MALQVDFELDGIINRDSYLRIHKIRTQMVDYEFFKAVDDVNRPGVAEELDWVIRGETTATAYVWSDQVARKNRVQPIKHFSFEFEFDLESPKNIYQQAYEALKSTPEFSSATDV
jgi:hypothetical protein